MRTPGSPYIVAGCLAAAFMCAPVVAGGDDSDTAFTAKSRRSPELTGHTGQDPAPRVGFLIREPTS